MMISEQDLYIRNFTGNATKSIFTILPTGQYKLVINGWIRNETLGKVVIVGRVDSSYKDTFGWNFGFEGE